MQLFRRKEEEFDRHNNCYICKKPLIEGEYFRVILFDQYKNMTDDPTNTNDSYVIVEFRIHEECITRKNSPELAVLLLLKRNVLVLKNGEQPPFRIVFDGHNLEPQILS